MDIPELIGELVRERLAEYFEDVDLWPIPRIYPPADEKQLELLERQSGQRLEETYGAFLALTDGLDGFYLTMPILGCKDWGSNGPAQRALRFRDMLMESGTPEDVGLPRDVELFPISVNEDASQAIFMIGSDAGIPERFWWVGEGDSQFFGTFADLLAYALDSSLYSPRENVG
ncbi:SMI1/KNR4 family protein [Streptomyces sp. NBC_01565]|uniref:SMI1/KNR4 family protein n=1 Tax=Streptomyces sp. NBC_01565 TaxID=2975881 RepID=UPI00224E0B82|nr:SMI1/KNR4 family protein [Streptomyces sp. NBC_01565]MCX4546139.1 SMI1/KNR4 family protein [Streptomyces sp. NBC_01565]